MLVLTVCSSYFGYYVFSLVFNPNQSGYHPLLSTMDAFLQLHTQWKFLCICRKTVDSFNYDYLKRLLYMYVHTLSCASHTLSMCVYGVLTFFHNILPYSLVHQRITFFRHCIICVCVCCFNLDILEQWKYTVECVHRKSFQTQFSADFYKSIVSQCVIFGIGLHILCYIRVFLFFCNSIFCNLSKCPFGQMSICQMSESHIKKLWNNLNFLNPPLLQCLLWLKTLLLLY